MNHPRTLAVRVQSAFRGVARAAWQLRFQISFIAFLIACFLVFFVRLGYPTVLMWDESRVAVNALEMLTSGNYLVTSYDGQPDLWNTKPPLLVWLIVGFMHLIGVNELALRLPSALSATAVAISLVLFARYYLRDTKAGIISGMVLITSIGFVGEHVARTGDYDALLVLWMLIYSLAYFAYLHADGRKTLYLLLATSALILAVWTKGIAGLMFLPGLLLYTLLQRKLRLVLASPQVYIAAAVFLVFSVGFYLLRELQSPGYLEAVVGNELLARYSATLEGHRGRFLFYFDGAFSRFLPWIYILPLCIVITWFSKKQAHRRFCFYLSLSAISYFLVISFAKTKLPWYDAPLYPLAALLIGMGLSEAFSLLAHHRNGKGLILTGLFLGVFALPYADMVYTKIYKQHGLMYEWSKPSNLELGYGGYMRQLTGAHPELDHFHVVNDNYNAHLLFYVKVARLDGQSVDIVTSDERFASGTTVVTCIPEIRQRLERQYVLELIHLNGHCHTFAVSATKVTISNAYEGE